MIKDATAHLVALTNMPVTEASKSIVDDSCDREMMARAFAAEQFTPYDDRIDLAAQLAVWDFQRDSRRVRTRRIDNLLYCFVITSDSRTGSVIASTVRDLDDLVLGSATEDGAVTHTCWVLPLDRPRLIHLWGDTDGNSSDWHYAVTVSGVIKQIGVQKYRALKDGGADNA